MHTYILCQFLKCFQGNDHMVSHDPCVTTAVDVHRYICDEPHPLLIKDMIGHCEKGDINEA